MRHSRLLVAFLLLLPAAFAPGPAQACSCVPPDRVDLAQFVARMPVFFWGRAAEVRVEGRFRVYLFEVAAAKGALPVRVELRTNLHGAACGATFAIGQPMLVGAGLRDGVLSANSCTQYVIRVRRAEIERLLGRCRPFGTCP